MKRTLLLVILLFTYYYGQSQRVGLVLSGGGAKGLSHIGVIKALEENNIPIDYISGTSMGALVGGMYAIGMSPEEMIKMVTSPEFLRWSTGQIEDEYLYLYKKLDAGASMFSFKFSLKDSISSAKLPTNLVPTHQMDLAILQHFAGPTASAKSNFDSLFIPFRCVASDVYNSKQYIARKGDVGSAIRASMTFPFFFKAISIDSSLLFDGGIYNNFPWDVLEKDFNPDFIIGSNCASNPEKPDEENILKQIETMIVSKTNYKIPHEKGITIDNIYGDVSLLDFSKAQEIIDKAYKATLSKLDSIRQKVNRRVTPLDLSIRRSAYKRELPNLQFRSIAIDGLSSSQREYVTNVFQSKKKTTFDFKKFKNEYFKLLSDNTITSIYPIAAYNNTLRLYDLRLKIKANNDLDLDFGGNISSSSMNQGYLGLTYKHFAKNYTRLFSNIYFGKLYSSFQMGLRQDFAYGKPFFYDVVFTLQRIDFFNSNPEPFFEDLRPSYIKQYEYFGRVNYGFPVSSSSFFKFGYNFGRNNDQYYQVNNFMKGDEPDKTDFSFHKVSISYEKNTLNYTLFPYKGRRQYVGFSYITGKEVNKPGTTGPTQLVISKWHNWMGVRFYNQSYHRISDKLWTGLLLDGILTDKKAFSNYTSSVLSAPSFTPYPQSQTIFLPNFRSDSYFAVGIMPNILFSPRIYLRAEAYAFMPFYQIEKANDYFVKYGKLLKERFYMGSLSMVYQTVVGPLSLSVNYYDKENTKFYFVANFGFVLFNRRSLEY